MSERFRLDPREGKGLRQLLLARGLELPCGGNSLCGGCKVRLIEGDVPITQPMRDVLSEEELRNGWRLGCHAQAGLPVVVEVEEQPVSVLTDEATVPMEPGEGVGIAIDLGTTTLAVQLVDLATGEILGLRTALNPQCRHGADVMSRIQFELATPGVLGPMIRDALGGMVAELAAGLPLSEVLIVGNTVMHHLFCGLDVKTLAHAPFRSPAPEGVRLDARSLGWAVPAGTAVEFLPCVGGFVGSDLLVGLAAVGMGQSAATLGLLDLGTNGEIAIGSSRGIVCASTAAGPAFEGGRIRGGMRAGTGAIDRVSVENVRLKCHVIGGGRSRGICGSGLVDAVAAALDLGLMTERGRICDSSKELALDEGTVLVQADIRELQVAKAAIRAGVDLLAQEIASDQARPARVLLAGAFGNYVRAESARRIGLIPAWAEPVEAAGNSALRGARMLLLSRSSRVDIVTELLAKTRHVELATDPGFQDVFIDRMVFA